MIVFSKTMPSLSAAALLLAALTLSGCAGGDGPETAALAAKPLQKSQARLKISRPGEFVAGLADARVQIDGKEAASIASGETRVIDVPAGAHQIVVDHWGHPNVYKLDLQTKPGMRYDLQITARGEAAMAGAVFGVLGSLAEAAANENGGTFQIQLVQQKPAG